ncbi:MAG: M23 family metallopeptidase [Hyphomicrobiaceae bacterium]
MARWPRLRLLAMRLAAASLVFSQAAAAGATCNVTPFVALHRPVDLDVTAAFGMRVHPLLGRQALHSGVDFAGPLGTPVRSASTGVVVTAAYQGGNGNLVVLRHGDVFSTSYAHLARIDVKVGDCITAGQLLGRLGTTGLSSAPHLHFEVWKDDQAIDPAPMLLAQ